MVWRIDIKADNVADLELEPRVARDLEGQWGKVAKSDAHNLYERLKRHQASVMRLIGNLDAGFSGNFGERAIRMDKMKLKVSGCSGTGEFAMAWR